MMDISMPLLDSHIHLFRGGYASRYDSAWANRDEVALYEVLRRAHHIERALVVGYEGEPQFKGNNRDLAEWAQERDWMTPLEYFDVENPPSPAHLDEGRHVFAGIALYVETPQQARVLAEWPRALFRWLNKNRSIISLNAAPESLNALGDFVEQTKDCDILISHLGSPGSFPETPSRREVLQQLEPLRRLSTRAHVGVKVSGLYGISDPSHDYPHRSAHPFLNQLRDDFGAQRLFWGSDFAPALEHVSFAQTIDAIAHLNWPPDEVTAIMGANLRQLLEKRRQAT